MRRRDVRQVLRCLLFGIVLRRFHRALSAMRRPHTMNANDLTQAFRGDYGRLCTLVAQALTQGHEQQSVVEAACGRGQAVAPVYQQLRRQRKQVNSRLLMCKSDGQADADLVAHARQIRTAVEQEWQRRIPMMAMA